jgi:hypothetical protein
MTHLEAFNNIDEYSPNQIEEYNNDYFSNDRFDDSPFVFQDDYKNKTSDDICKQSEFDLGPQQKFAGKFISTETTFPGVLIYHGLGSGKSCTSIVIGEAMKNRKIVDGEFEEPLKGRSPYKVFIVVPKANKEQYYEEIMGRIMDGNIASCTGACVIIDNDSDDGRKNRQFYVGKYNRKTKQYSSPELKEIAKLQKSGLDKKRLSKLINEFHSKVDTVYNIITHDKFLNKVMVTQKGTGKLVPTKFLLDSGFFKSSKSLLVIDEIQKLVREEGSKYNKLYNTLMLYARNTKTGQPTTKVVLLTATPVYDNPHEAALMINLLRPRIQFPLNREQFQKLFIGADKQFNKNLKNQYLLSYMLSGYVSYFKGGNPNGYPYRRNHIKLHKMEEFQQKGYTRALVAEIKKETERLGTEESQINTKLTELKEDEQKKEDGTQGMYPVSIQKCNISYETSGGEIKNSTKDIKAFGKKLKEQESKKGILKEASKYSKKFVDIIKLIKESPGPVFIYSKWIPHGIMGIYTILDALGWEFFDQKSDLSKKRKRYAIWSPGGLASKGIEQESQQSEYIEYMRQVFNSPKNKDGNLCKVLISNVVEGISLKRINQVHVCEPWWNMSKMEQIIARAIRLCSHGDLPEDRRYVDVYYHASVLNTYPTYNPKIQTELRDIDPMLIYFKDLSRSTIEQKMYITSEKKQKINVQFEQALKRSAVDCNLNKNGNLIRLEETIIPDTETLQSRNTKIDEDTPLLYNRSNNKYYILNKKKDKLYHVDIIETMEVEKTNKTKDITQVRNWPPVSFKKTKDNIKLQPWQIQKSGGNTSITLLENVECDISSRTSNVNFEVLYDFAMGKGEEYSSWKYAHDTFRKLEQFPKLAVKYNLMKGSSGVALQNCLYKSLQTASTNGLWTKNERKTKTKLLESLLIKNKALGGRQKLIAKLKKKVSPKIQKELKSYTYPELEALLKNTNKKK